jgi:Fe-S-cluster containining protein
MQGRKKLTDADKAKRDAKRAKRAAAEPTAPSSGPTLGALVIRDDLVRTVAKSTRALISAATEFVETSAKTHLRVISCHTCTAPKGCCKLPVTLLFHEVLPVADRLRRDGRDTPELRARLAESAELMETLTRAQYRELVRPCVFLDAEERCTVYEERPRECGSAFVFSPSIDCSDLSVTEIETALPDMEPVRHKLWVTERLVEQSLGLPRVDGTYVGVLPRMVLLWLETWDRTDFADHLAERMVAAANAR